MTAAKEEIKKTTKPEEVKEIIKEVKAEETKTEKKPAKKSPKKIEVKEEEINMDEMSMEQLFSAQDDFSKELKKKEVVNVRVVQITDENILVDIGDKKEGLISVKEFEGRDIPKEEDTIPAILLRPGSEERHAILSNKRAMESVGWEKCKEIFDTTQKIRGVVKECVKGGYMVDVMGVAGFMPLSLSEIHRAFKHYLPIGAKVKCKIVEFSKEKNKLILSRKEILAEEEKTRQQEVVASVKEGEILRTVVSKVGRDKLFLRFHGIEGFVELENVAWKDKEEMLKKYRRGQRIRAKLMKIDSGDKPRLEFGLKQLYLSPSEFLKKRYPFRSTPKATIEKITEEGVEVSLGKNNKGFINSYELGRDFEAKEGDSIKVLVLGIDTEKFIVNLSVKKYESFQNRKIVKQYMRQAPRPTLGQLLDNNTEDK
ncbi:MAG: 30S ribosomal protein S1 [Elusimicrobiaceae bacterium]|jgi:small subunit ribosomal protein S1|nr:30S ribosomal protein S1 [Elusimicrobiaceae bacterium]MBT3954610.1 30S ribosomal protein S1 [Elusimicrobiaceae bacterium]MBT4007918.1 30S ribosomal protein S1 [Elusimicrobiaceae bacterium]MBT4403156.1 30S ribosomal protein S1 [Elusimicrobiaceae bacterium]MBT4439932.1 30S ribosomal protein S1 [Elusimicrobiaceae bacterium]